MKVLEDQSVFVAASVEKFGGGAVIVDAIAAAPEENGGVDDRIRPPISGVVDTEPDPAV